MRLKNIFLIVFLIISFFPLLDFLHPGLPITHDGKDHVARIANFYANLEVGNIVPRWAENLNWGYGHPILMFLYPLPSYIASLFHLFGLSFVNSTKLVFAVSFVLSGIAMYLWLSRLYPYQVALFGSTLYMYAPYRFVDLYVRGDLGESVAFIFPPLVCYFLYTLSQKASKTALAGTSLTIAGLILAHNAVVLMFMPIIFLYVLYLYWQTHWSRRFLVLSILFILLGFGLSAFFWIPALFEGKYTLRNIVTPGDVESNFVTLQELIYGPWSYGISGQFTVQVGILQWLSVLFSFPLLAYLYSKKNRNWIYILALLVIFFISIFMMTKSSEFIWERFSILQNFQFPWRFLSVSVFVSSVLGTYIFYLIPKQYLTPLLIILFVIAFFLNSSYWHANGYLQKPESFYSGIFDGTTDTGESAPIWSVRFMEHRPDKPVDIIGGRARVKVLQRTPTYHHYMVDVTKNAQLRENTLYFPGWKILVDGAAVPIEYQDMNSRGIMTFYIPRGVHDVVVIFTETKLRLISDIFEYPLFVSAFRIGYTEEETMAQLTIALATFNEAGNLDKCLASVADIASEIVIVDGSSSDKTVEIAKKYHAKVHVTQNRTNFHINKQKAIDMSSNDWILLLDADEIVSPDLAGEIQKVIAFTASELNAYEDHLKNRSLFLRHQKLLEHRDGRIGVSEGDFTAFFIPRLNYFLGKYLRYGGVYPDGVIRLFKKGLAYLPAKDVHEQMVVEGRVGWLNYPLYHMDSPTFKRYVVRNNRYIEFIAKQLEEKKTQRDLKTSADYFFIKPFSWFFLTQIRHKGILDGYQGIVFSFFSALRFPRAYWRYIHNHPDKSVKM